MSKKHKDNIVKLFAKVLVYFLLGGALLSAFFISLNVFIGALILSSLTYLKMSDNKSAAKKTKQPSGLKCR